MYMYNYLTNLITCNESQIVAVQFLLDFIDISINFTHSWSHVHDVTYDVNSHQYVVYS